MARNRLGRFRRGRRRTAGGVSTNGTNGVARLRGTDHLSIDGSGETILAVSTTFALVLFGAAPGTQGGLDVLPRLNYLGKSYSEYRWVSCTVRFKSSAGSTTAGRIIMAATYDPSGDIPATVGAELLETYPHVVGSVWRNHSLIVPCGRNNFQLNWYPVDILQTGAEANLTTPFMVNIGTDLGTVATPGTPIGTVEVDWVIDFKNPITPLQNPT